MKCPVCNLNTAKQDRMLGILPCKSCQGRQSTFNRPNKQVEFTSEAIKDSRKEYMKSILQPFRDGKPSREFAEAYPEVAEKTFKDYKKKEIKNVWSDITRGLDIKKSK